MHPRQLLEAFLTPARSRELAREQELLARAETTSLTLAPSRFARGGGDEVKVYRWGQGERRVLLVHGWGSRASHFEALATELEARGYRVVSFDAPGHGRSGGVLSSAPAMAGAIRVVVAQEGEFQAVVAHSLGAVATSIVLDKELRVERAALLGSCCWVEPLARAFAHQQGADDETTQAMVDLARKEFLVGEISAELSARRFGNIPVLMMHDPADKEMPYEHTAALAAAWPGAKVVDTPGVGHRRILRAREIIARTIEHFAC